MEMEGFLKKSANQDMAIYLNGLSWQRQHLIWETSKKKKADFTSGGDSQLKRESIEGFFNDGP